MFNKETKHNITIADERLLQVVLSLSLSSLLFRTCARSSNLVFNFFYILITTVFFPSFHGKGSTDSLLLKQSCSMYVHVLIPIASFGDGS